MNMQLANVAKLGRSIKELGEHPRQISKLITLLKELDAEEISLISSCFTNLAKLKRSKRIALWKKLE